jgi:hypothetical protein
MNLGFGQAVTLTPESLTRFRVTFNSIVSAFFLISVKLLAGEIVPEPPKILRPLPA